MDTEYYKTFRATGISKKTIDKQIVHKLFKRPEREERGKGSRIETHIAKNNTHQADLLFMPNDGGFKYALVVVDVATGITDAEALKSKGSDEVADGLKKIYTKKLHILNKPRLLQVDPGSEFKGDTAELAQKMQIYIRYGKTGRSRQQALVESRNGTIAKALFMRMASEEILNGEPSTEWVFFLPEILRGINKDLSHKADPDHEYGDVIDDGKALLQIGSHVRIQLDKPRGLLGEKKLSGAFRKTDIRWSTEIYKIEDIQLIPDQPVFYKLENLPYVFYTRYQLQTVDADEENPPSTVLRKHDNRTKK